MTNSEIVEHLLSLIEIQQNVLEDYVQEDPMAADIYRDLGRMKFYVEQIAR